jgi:hypothetical protein
VIRKKSSLLHDPRKIPARWKLRGISDLPDLYISFPANYKLSLRVVSSEQAEVFKIRSRIKLFSFFNHVDVVFMNVHAQWVSI